MVLVTVAVAAFVANWGPPDGWLLLHTLLGTALVAASASALESMAGARDRRADAAHGRSAIAGRPLDRRAGRRALAS